MWSHRRKDHFGMALLPSWQTSMISQLHGKKFASWILDQDSKRLLFPAVCTLFLKIPNNNFVLHVSCGYLWIVLHFRIIWVAVKKKPRGSIYGDSLLLCHIKLVQCEATLSKTVNSSESLEPVLTREVMTGTSPSPGCLIKSSRRV